MRRVFAVMFALLVPAGAAHAQAPPDPVIAAGVSAAGLDLSGLTLGAAAGKLYAADAPVLGRPVSVHAAGHRFPLAVTALKLRFDVNRTARRAYNAGQKAGGRRVDVPLAVSYRQRKLRAYAAEVARAVHRAPRDASIQIRLRHIRRLHSRPGRAISAAGVVHRLHRALTDTRRPRIVHPPVRMLRPSLTSKGLGRRYPTIITIDRGAFRLRLFKHLHVAARYPVAVGQPAYPTPTGLFHVLDKQVNPVWSVPNSPWAGELAGTTVEGGSAANPLKARWMGLGGGVGIHGTGEDWSIGTRASHGCIRMHVSDVIPLFNRVPLGTPVLIGD
jgi:L,D-transpeptidase catalytic domain/Putative peptidoglycan binding domain